MNSVFCEAINIRLLLHVHFNFPAMQFDGNNSLDRKSYGMELGLQPVVEFASSKPYTRLVMTPCALLPRQPSNELCHR